MHSTHYRAVFNEAEDKFSYLFAIGQGLCRILSALTYKFFLKIYEALLSGSRVSSLKSAKQLTVASWGKSVTNAMNNSQPAFKLIGLAVLRFKVSAPSLSALTSSNIVPARSLA